MGPTIKALVIFVIIYFLIRRLLKPFRDFKKQVKQSQQTTNHKVKETNITDDLGDYIDYEEIKE